MNRLSDHAAWNRLRHHEDPTNKQSTEPLDAAPLVTIAPYGQTLRVVHGNQAAWRSGLHSGQTLADARAIVPRLDTREDDPTADRSALESLATWAGRLSPVVHLEGDDTLILDVTGCERLFGGAPDLLQQAITGLAEQEFGCRGAIADTLGAAWALAHAHSESAVVAETGRTAAYLGPLPVRSLRIDARTVDTLRSIGIETVASLLHLPRSSLACRFGDALLDRVDQALGDQPEVWTPFRPPSALASRIEFGSPTTSHNILSEGIHVALTRFCAQLDRRTSAARTVYVTFHCANLAASAGTPARTVTQEVPLSQPTRSARRLGRLLTTLLERVRLPAPAAALTIWTRNIEPLNDQQEELFSSESRDDRALTDLLDRLAVRLGRHAVARVEPLSDHQPERAFRYVSLMGNQTRNAYGKENTVASDAPTGSTPTASRRFKPLARRAARARTAPCANEEMGLIPDAPSSTHQSSFFGLPQSSSRVRPLWLAEHPIEAVVTAVVPDGPPIAVRTSHAQENVIHCVGPERIETGWWRGAHLRRDYYRVTTERGQRLWMFRDRTAQRWFLHGWFD